MTVESGSFIDELEPGWPLAGDFLAEADNHMRKIKECVQGSFGNLGLVEVTATAPELNTLIGATGTLESRLVALETASFTPFITFGELRTDNFYRINVSTTASGWNSLSLFYETPNAQVDIIGRHGTYIRKTDANGHMVEGNDNHTWANGTTGDFVMTVDVTGGGTYYLNCRIV